MDKARISIDEDTSNVSKLKKQLKQNKQEADNLLSAIQSGNVKGQALVKLSDKYNKLDESIQNLEKLVCQKQQTKQTRTLTYNYFKDLCHEGSRVLTHSSLAEKRSFIEKCIESVTLDPVRKTVNLKFDINPFYACLNRSKSTKKLEVSGFDTSSEMVAGAGFEPTTFGL